MYNYHEYSAVCAIPTGPRVFFHMYFKVADNAFKYAADTWMQDMRSQHAFRSGYDVELTFEVLTERDFKWSWDVLANLPTDWRIIAGGLFTHASLQTDGRDGLEFRPDGPADNRTENGTLTQAEIRALPLLRWHYGAHLLLASCNSGNRSSWTRTRGWTPAQTFCDTQRVTTLGQTGFAYFSRSWSNFLEKSPRDRTIALWAYSRRANSPLGMGGRMEANVFRPPARSLVPRRSP